MLQVFQDNNTLCHLYVHLALENCEDLSKNHWAAVYMVASNKYLPPVNKDGITYYYPERLATREEVIVSIAKLKGIKKTDTSILNQFTDTNFMSNSSKAVSYTHLVVVFPTPPF